MINITFNEIAAHPDSESLRVWTRQLQEERTKQMLEELAAGGSNYRQGEIKCCMTCKWSFDDFGRSRDLNCLNYKSDRFQKGTIPENVCPEWEYNEKLETV